MDRLERKSQVTKNKGPRREPGLQAAGGSVLNLFRSI